MAELKKFNDLTLEEIQLECARKDLRFVELREEYWSLRIEHEKLCMAQDKANHEAYIASLNKEEIEIARVRKEDREREIEHRKREELHWRVIEEIFKGKFK